MQKKKMRFWCIPQQFKAPQHGPAEGMSSVIALTYFLFGN
jgi:hypothetical protein